MHRELLPIFCAFYLLSACHRLSPTEEKFVGTWSHSSMDATDFQVLGQDHSIIVFFPEDQQDSSKDIRVFRVGSGKWRIEGNDFIQEIDSELPVFPENTPIPKMVISRKIIDVRHDKIVFDHDSPFLRQASLPPIAR
jgi:hypothetical protein